MRHNFHNSDVMRNQDEPTVEIIRYTGMADESEIVKLLQTSIQMQCISFVVVIILLVAVLLDR